MDSWLHAISKDIPNITVNPLDLGADMVADTLLPTDLVLEFGVYSGRTLRTIGAYLPRANIYGFDSFEGLPETWRPGYEIGEFNMHRQPPSNLPKNALIVVGWFDETLPRLVDHHAAAGHTVGLLHVDCDIYSSTKTIFDELARGKMFRDGTVIVFDEAFNYPGFENHEIKAFYEFLQSHPEFDVEWLGMNGSIISFDTKEEEEGGQQVVCKLVLKKHV